MLSVGGKNVYSTLEELVHPGHTALLLIDLQNDYLTAGGCSDRQGMDVSPLRQIIPSVTRVLEAARRSGTTVIHVQMSRHPHLTESAASLRRMLLRSGLSGAKSLDELSISCIDSTWGSQIVDELAPLPGEIVIKKHRPSAFVGTDLDMILRSNDRKSLAITGVVTQSCVMATAFDASFFDYYPVLLRDCISSSRHDMHEAALLILSQVSDVCRSEDVIEVWKQSRGGLSQEQV